ncbi:chromate efflux transporter [Roseibium denhamense]|uniref:Chromate transporter n=1 Tax=Roseibium denhamense TaxID=76305 RepID=A0ABY1P5U2_9HYPH|nr:chromate efflux transporter [Roseibium denhamense]MTI05221.1 chromate efflux transporter [Roseibium denhamense]SMP25570.1 chromate transporter [Roseibium denhamense]
MTSESPNITDAAKTWLKIGFLSFGGPAAQIALMHKVLVDETKWLTEKTYLNALSFCMLLPGPEAMQLAAWSGWRLHGVLGGLIAGLSFILPGAFVVLVLAALYAVFGTTPLVTSLFLGIKAAVIVIVLEALMKVAKRALKRQDHWVLAALAFAAIFFFGLPFPVIIVIAATYGYLTTRGTYEPAGDETRVPLAKTLKTAGIWLALWLVPLGGLWLSLGSGHLIVEIGLLFSKLAVVTFGGAYAVLTYLSQEVVINRAWLTPTEMIDALGLAETTPGPLILVTEFVAYLAGAKAGGLVMGLAAAFVGLWMTFIPCFLWVFTGAPYIDRLDRSPRLSGALAGITASVVGVILNLGVWFALHSLFGTVTQQTTGPLQLWVPELASFDWRALLLTVLAGVLLLRFKIGLFGLLGIMSLSGWAISQI